MRLIIVRHADPDYEKDSLTPGGWREAELAAKRIKKIDEQCGGIKAIYVSPLGRAQDTASCSLKLLNRDDAITCEWLREFFAPQIKRPDIKEGTAIAWDWLPKDWTSCPEFYNVNEWKKNSIMQAGEVGREYDRVCTEFDKLLATHGYVRCDEQEGQYYRVENSNTDTIVFFCHFGVESVLLSHLCHCSPMILWHSFCAAPSSVTTVITEERREGIASFRINGYGDVSHLYVAGEEPSFSARFRECYGNDWERRD